LLLDYDGSLVPFSKDYKQAAPPKSLLTLLEKLGSDGRNDVVLISGREAKNLEEWFGDLPVTLVAEHGMNVRKADGHAWQSTDDIDTKWKNALRPVLEEYADLTPKARVEIKPHSLVWHYRNSPPYYAQKYAVTLKRVLKPLLKQYGLQLLQGNKALEIKNPRINKGIAAQRWLEKDYDLILSIGDDATDEELFGILDETAYSIKVGRGRTSARFRLSDPAEVIKLLKRLAR
jgi:trehalose 6-phosphate synthase/phosphatase